LDGFLLLTPKLFKQFLTKYITTSSLHQLYKSVILNTFKEEHTDFSWLQKTYEIYEDGNRIKKQIDSLTNNIIKNNIIKFWKDKSKIICNNYSKEYNKLKINIKKFNTFTTKLKTNPSKYIPLWDDYLIVLKNNIIQINRFILYAHALIMDIYIH
jgi:hypothetical protein